MLKIKIPGTIAAALLACLGPFASAQHETGSDLLGGEQAFQNLCANCHGMAGNLIPEIDLGRGIYRQAYTDEQLASIILTGIPNTPMPPNPGMTPEQAGNIVAYLRSRALQTDISAGGDAARGKTLFEGKGECFSCHRIAAQGSRLGPDLGNIGVLRTPDELAGALLDPDAVVLPANRSYAVTTKAGEEVKGRLLNQDMFTVQLLDTDEQLRSFQKSELRAMGFIPSPMPSLRGDFDEQELADLVQYLASLRGAETP